jgi:hypothetical protein
MTDGIVDGIRLNRTFETTDLDDFVKPAALVCQCRPPKAVKCCEETSVSLTVQR